MNLTVKTVIFWIVVVISATLLWQVVRTNGSAQRVPEISYSQFLSQVEAGKVASVRISKSRATGTYGDGGSFLVIVPPSQDLMLQLLQQKNVEVRYSDQYESTNWLVNLAPLFVLAALWYFMIRQIRARSKPQLPAVSA